MGRNNILASLAIVHKQGLDISSEDNTEKGRNYPKTTLGTCRISSSVKMPITSIITVFVQKDVNM